MSKRRKPGEVVRRIPGSGFLGAEDPKYVRVPTEPHYEDEMAPCIMGCGDDDCREWANLEVVGGKWDGQCLCHISECQMEDDDRL